MGESHSSGLGTSPAAHAFPGQGHVPSDLLLARMLHKDPLLSSSPSPMLF